MAEATGNPVLVPMAMAMEPGSRVPATPIASEVMSGMIVLDSRSVVQCLRSLALRRQWYLFSSTLYSYSEVLMAICCQSTVTRSLNA